jgi:hypothetical protein
MLVLVLFELFELPLVAPPAVVLPVLLAVPDVDPWALVLVTKAVLVEVLVQSFVLVEVIVLVEPGPVLLIWAWADAKPDIPTTLSVVTASPVIKFFILSSCHKLDSCDSYP